MENDKWQKLLDCAVSTVKQAAEMALKPGIELNIETKSNRNDLVTDVDKAIEQFIADQMTAATRYSLLGDIGLSCLGRRRA